MQHHRLERDDAIGRVELVEPDGIAHLALGELDVGAAVVVARYPHGGKSVSRARVASENLERLDLTPGR